MLPILAMLAMVLMASAMQDLTTGSVTATCSRPPASCWSRWCFRRCLSWSISTGSAGLARSRCRSRRRRQPHVHRAGALTDARRRDDHGGVACGRPEETDRAVLLFNQSQVLSLVSGVAFLVVMMTVWLPCARTLAADATTATLAAEYLLWFIPAMSLRLRWSPWARRCAAPATSSRA